MALSRNYALGLLFIVLVSVIWAAASVLVQYLYSGQSFHSPFLLTYIGVSLFSLFIPSQWITQWLRRRGPCHRDNNDVVQENGRIRHHEGHDDNNGSSLGSLLKVPVESVLGRGDSSSTQQSYEQVPTDTASPDNEHTELHDQDHAANHSRPEEDRGGEHRLSFEHAEATPHNLAWSNEQHFRAACMIAPVWFLANWTYNASLAYTSITSSTVLASTGSLFTFLFAVIAKDEHFTVLKFAGVLLGFAGSVVTTFGDSSSFTSSSSSSSSSPDQEASSDTTVGRYPIIGDILGLVSAVGYGAYAVQARLLCPHDESLYSMQLLLGYIGLINMTLLSPIALFEVWGQGSGLTWKIFGFLVVKGLLDNVLSDYLWLRAVVLINATVATVGLGLTIPLAFVSDLLLGKPSVLTAGSIFGALLVLAGFVLVNLGNEEDSDGPKETSTHHSISMQSIPERGSAHEGSVPDDQSDDDIRRDAPSSDRDTVSPSLDQQPQEPVKQQHEPGNNPTADGLSSPTT